MFSATVRDASSILVFESVKHCWNTFLSTTVHTNMTAVNYVYVMEFVNAGVLIISLCFFVHLEMRAVLNEMRLFRVDETRYLHSTYSKSYHSVPPPTFYFK